MPKSQFQQTSFASGELSPLLMGRTDLEQYYKGAQDAENVVIVPQGGVKRRPGTQFIDTVVKPLVRQSAVNPSIGLYDGQTVGGNPTLINDGNDSTYSITDANFVNDDEWVIATYNLGANPSSFEFVDVRNVTVLLTTPSNGYDRAGNIFIEHSNSPQPNSFTRVGSFRIDNTSERSHRVNIDGIVKRYWRITTDFRVGAAYRLRIGEFALKSETGTTNRNEVKTFNWEYAADQNYLCVLTEGNLRFYRTPHAGSSDTTVVADVVVPYAGADVSEVKVAQTEGVMLMFHGDYPPERVIFNGNDNADAFTSGEVPFANVPEWDYDDKYSPLPVTHIQDVQIGSGFEKGGTYQIDVQGVLSKNITFAGDQTTDEQNSTAFNLQKNLQDMPVFNNTGVTVTRTATRKYRIEVANDSADFFELFAGFATGQGTGSNRDLAFEIIQQGSPRHEPVWSVKPDVWVANNAYSVGDSVLSTSGLWYSCIEAGTSNNITPWSAGTSITVNTKRSNLGNVYVCTVAGVTGAFPGPSGTGTGIIDNTVTWDYVSIDGPAGTGDEIEDGSVTWKYIIQRGYPKQGIFYEGRLWLGGVKPRQQSLFASRAGSFLDFYSVEGDDDHGIFITIDSRELTNIVDINPDRGLQVFTAGAEFTLTGLTPSTIEVEAQTQHGSFNLEAKSVDGATLFVDKNGNTLRQYLYSFNEDAYTSNDLSVLSSQLINNPKDMAILSGTTTEDANWVFIINEDGTAAVLNTMRDQDINGFTRWTPHVGISGGNFTRENTLQSCSAVGDDLYQVVSRTTTPSGGSVDIEKWDFDYLLESSYKVTVTAAVPNADVFVPIAGGVRLQSYTVGVVADGNVLPNRVVTQSGSNWGVTITAAELNGFTTRDLEIGLNFPVKVKGMPLNTNPGTRGGQNTMKRKKITNINLRVYNSAGIYIDGIAAPIRQIGETQDDPFTTPFTARTGIIEDQNGGNGWDTEVVPEITVPDATPFHLQAIQYEVESS
jgi:hypothetical protein